MGLDDQQIVAIGISEADVMAVQMSLRAERMLFLRQLQKCPS